MHLLTEQLQKIRYSLTKEEWSNYLQDTYPDLWKQEFKNVMFFNIIYYPTNYHYQSHPSIVYPFYSNCYSTMKQIRFKFNKFISQQHLVIKLCFGNDIYQIIKNYLPELSNLSNNYIYIHKYINKYIPRQILSFNRYKTDDNLTLNQLIEKLPNQKHDSINLRIRNKKFKINSSNWSTKFNLVEI